MKVLTLVCSALVIVFQSFSASYTVFSENGKVGLKNEAGQILIPAQYEEIGWSDGSFSVQNNVTGYRNGGLWGLINLENHKITKQNFEELLPAESGLIIAKMKTRTSVRALTGCINGAGKEIIPFQYDGITVNSFRAIVFTRIGNDYKYGVIDLSNKTIIPQQYADIKSIGTLRFAVKNFDDKIALFSDQGKQVTAFSIDSISYFVKNHAVFHEGVNKGILSRDGNIKIPAKYRDVVIVDESTFKVRQADSWTFYKGDNSVVRQWNADSVVLVAPNVFKVRTGNMVQLCNEKFEPITKQLFEDIGTFSTERAVCEVNNRYGVVNLRGELVLPASFEHVNVYLDGIVSTQKGNPSTQALFDRDGARLTSKPYEHISPLGGGLFAAKTRNYWGVINGQGREVLTCVYDSLVQFRDNVFVVKFHGLYGIVSVDEKWIAVPRADRLKLLNDSRYLQFTPTATELRAYSGSVIYFTSNPVTPSNDHLLETTSTGDVWKIDFDGLIVERQYFPKEVEKVYEESEGYRVIKRNGRYGFVDSKGRLRIANRYEDVSPFKEGFAAVKILGKWGFINQSDNLAIQPVYEQVFSFKAGRAIVKQKGLYGMVDTGGKLILPVRYERIETLPSGNLLITTAGMTGLTDKNGNMLITPRYNKLVDTGKDYAIVEKSGKFGVVHYNGISTIPIVYDYITYDPNQDLFLVLLKKEWESITH